MTIQTAFLKITYESDLDSAIAIPSYTIVNDPDILIKSITLYDPESEDLGSGLLDDTIDAIEDADEAKDQPLVDALTSILALDPNQIGIALYVRKTRKLAKDALDKYNSK